MTAPVATGGHHRVVIIGGGNAGLSVAGRLRRAGVRDIVVIEPREHHFYQPLFSHVAGGTAPASMARRGQAEVMPRGVTWIQDRVADVAPESNTVVLLDSGPVTYDHLIVCPGIQNDWRVIPGLVEAMASPAGISNYEYDLARKASPLLRDVRGGTVVFTQPPGAASCAGAAQKPMYLACDYWRSQGVLGDIRVVMVVPDPTVFGMPIIDQELERKIAEYGIELRTETELVEVDAAARVAVLAGPGGAQERLEYDVLHVVPPQSAPDWLKATSLPAAGSTAGFVEVDPETLRHVRHPNVWSLGDAAATRNSKSGGALRKQTLVLAKNLAAVLKGRGADQRYDNYSVCPFTVSRSTVVFAEFDDLYRPMPSIPRWTGLARERRLTWIADRYILPRVYWYLILKGLA